MIEPCQRWFGHVRRLVESPLRKLELIVGSFLLKWQGRPKKILEETNKKTLYVLLKIRYLVEPNDVD